MSNSISATPDLPILRISLPNGLTLPKKDSPDAFTPMLVFDVNTLEVLKNKLPTAAFALLPLSSPMNIISGELPVLLSLTIMFAVVN